MYYQGLKCHGSNMAKFSGHFDAWVLCKHMIVEAKHKIIQTVK